MEGKGQKQRDVEAIEVVSGPWVANTGRVWMEYFNQLNISQVSRASYPEVNGIHFYRDAYIPLHLCKIIISHVAAKSKWFCFLLYRLLH